LAGSEKIADKKNYKRERIMEAASQLFSEKSFHEVMMEDVAKMASIAKGTLYNYFASKEDLYFSIMLIRMTNLISSLKSRIKEERTAIESLHSFVIHNYAFMVKYSCFFIMFQKDNLKAQNTRCAEFRERKNELTGTLKDIISEGIREKVFFTADPDFAAQVVLGSIYAAVNRAVSSSYSKEETDGERERLFDFILKGLSAGGPGKKLPLENKTLVITRTEEDSKDSAAMFSQCGAGVVLFPTLEVVPPESWEDFDSAIKEFGKTDILIFTSTNSVKMFIKRCSALGFKPNYSGIKVLAVGKKTFSVCSENGIKVSMYPKEFSAAGLLAELKENEVKGKNIFIPGSAIARKELPDSLKEMGAVVRTAAVYNTSVPSEETVSLYRGKLQSIRPDIFIFTSPSSFRNFLQIMEVKEVNKYFEGMVVAAIGPSTAREIESSGLQVDILPKEYTMEGILSALTEYFLTGKTA
jgi:uroporphyrinogen-III synthase/AcrR family transcriptional regulator